MSRMDTQDLPHLVPGRACGSCMMCCKVPHIEEFAKPAGVWCKHAVPGKGCGIYESRPGSCRAFYCMWMQDASFGPEWKPEKSKFVTRMERSAIRGNHADGCAVPAFRGACPWACRRQDPRAPCGLRNSSSISR